MVQGIARLQDPLPLWNMKNNRILAENQAPYKAPRPTSDTDDQTFATSSTWPVVMARVENRILDPKRTFMLSLLVPDPPNTAE